jgi:Ni,Fe-hydrogenase III large subunit/Ni,Fe-hydrogenase III component G
MTMLDRLSNGATASAGFAELFRQRWNREATCNETARLSRVHCRPDQIIAIAEWLMQNLDYAFATLVVEETPAAGWALTYVFYRDYRTPWVHLELTLNKSLSVVPSLVGLPHGPSVDWHEREVEDLFGLHFEGHPRLGEFVLHEDWPEGTNPLRRDFDPHRHYAQRAPNAKWEAPTIVAAPGAFAMPVGPVFADFAESAHFLLETVGEDVIRTIPRFFYKYRGVEKIAEGQPVDRALLLAERFSGTAAFAHGLAFCQAIETIAGAMPPPRALALRTVFAELERLRSHTAAVTGICNSTALAIATSQAALIEEKLLRLSCEVTGHRYLFGAVAPGGVACDLSEVDIRHLTREVGGAAQHLRELLRMLRYSSSFLDRLEEVGIVSEEKARSYGLVGPVARASGIARDMRKLFPYAAYSSQDFTIPIEQDGDGYARLRILFAEAQQSASIINALLSALPEGQSRLGDIQPRAGVALSAVEAPLGAAFHWLRLDEDGKVVRYRIAPPSFTNWHAFHLAAENFAFQDFPIILASFALSNAECDR